MAVRMGVYYRQPEDATTFEKRYLEEHLPLVRSYANIKSASFFKVSRSIAGDYPYSYVFIGDWADKDGFKADMSAPAAAEATEHAKSLGARFDVVLFEQLA